MFMTRKEYMNDALSCFINWQHDAIGARVQSPMT